MFDRIQKCANMINAKYKDYTLLDAGCRTNELQGYLMNCREYYGADLSESDGVLACDLTKKLPFIGHRWPNMFAYGSLFEESINK